MIDEEKLKIIKEQLKKTADELFKEKTAHIERALEKEKTLGNPKNFADPSDKKDEIL